VALRPVPPAIPAVPDWYHRTVTSTASAEPPSQLGARSARLAPPRIGEPTARLSPRLRSILDELDGIFVDEGFAHLTVGELAARLRCSRRTLYELAPTKDELVLVVIDRRMRRTGAIAAEQVNAITDPADRLDAFMMAGSSELKRVTLRFREDVAGFPAGQRLIATHYRYATALVGEILEEGIAQGRFRPLQVRVVAEIIDAALERLQEPEVLRGHGMSFEDTALELLALLRHGLAVEPGPAPAPAKVRRP
jgi:AcrR family transcriptional regulator